MKFLRRLFFTMLALVFLVEAWLWEHLGPAVRAIVALLPFRALKERLAALITRLPPYPSLLLFATPGVILLPMKLAAFWFIAHGQAVLGGMVFLAAKIVGFGVTAFIFETTKPKLMQLGWFARIHAWCVRTKDWAHGLVAPQMAWIKRKLSWLKPEKRSRLMAVIARWRARMARRRVAKG